MMMMDYGELYGWFLAESIILSAIAGAVITVVIKKIVDAATKPKCEFKEEKLNIKFVAAPVPSEEAMNAKHDAFIKYVSELKFE